MARPRTSNPRTLPRRPARVVVLCGVLIVCAVLFGGTVAQVSAQTTNVFFFDDFNRANSTSLGSATNTNNATSYNWTKDGAGGTNNARTAIVSSNLVISNTSSSGRDWAHVTLTNTSGFNTTYSSSTATSLEWYGNMRQIRSDPSGFNNGRYGAAWVIGASSNDFMGAGVTGYALVVGNTGSPDPLRFVHFTNGLSGDSALTDIITATNSGASIGNQRLSLKLTYNVASNSWSLFGTTNSSFVDPWTNSSLATYGTASNSTYTGTSLAYMGALWNYSTAGAQTANFDNFRIASVTAAATTGPYWADAAGGGGVGTWTAAGTNWATGLAGAGRGVTQSTNSTLIFANTGGTVTVSGEVTVNAGMQFATNGYTVTGGTIALAGATAASNTITTDAGVAATINSALTGSAGLTKAGNGTLTLGGANTYTNGTFVSAGRLVGTTTSLQGNITNNAAVTFNQSTEGTYSNVMSGSGSLTKEGTGTVTLSGANTYSGGSLISAGRLVGSTTSLQGAITNSAALTFDQSTNGTYSGVLSGSGSLLKTNAGTLTLSGNNSSFAGAVSIAAGAVRVSSAGALGNTTGSTTVSSGAALELTVSPGAEAISLAGSGLSSGGALRNISGNNTLSGLLTLTAAARINSDSGTLTLDVTSGNAITGTHNLTVGGAGNVTIADNVNIATGTLTKDGAGVLTLSGVNTYTGATTISEGRLNVTGSTAAGSAVAVNSGGTLGGGGTVGGAVTINSGGTVSPGTSPGTLTVGSMTWQGGGHYNWQLYDATGAAGTGWDLINATNTTGAFTLNNSSGNKFNINLWTLSGIGPDTNGSAINFSQTNNYSWLIAQSGSVITNFDAAAFNLSTSANNGTAGFDGFSGTFSLGLDDDEKGIVLNYAGAPPAAIDEWTGGTNGTGSAWRSSANWSNAAIPSSTAIASFGTNGTATVIGVNMNQAPSNIQEVGRVDLTGARDRTINNSSTATNGTFQINGVGGKLLVNSSSTNTLLLTNGSSRAMDVRFGAGGEIEVANAGAGIVIASTIVGTNGFTKTGAGVLELTASNSFTGAVTVSGGTLSLEANGALAGNSVVAVNAGGTLRSGVIGLTNTINDTAALTVSGNGIVDLSGGTETIGSLSSGSSTASLVIGDYEATAGSLVVGDATSTEFAGVISGTRASSGAILSKQGAGTLTLSGANTFSGDVAVSGGTLSIAANAALGATTNALTLANSTLRTTASFTLGSNRTVTIGAGGGTFFTESGTQLTFDGTLAGSNTLTKLGAGTFALGAGSSAFTGNTTVGAGTMLLTSAAALSNSTVTVSNGAVLTNSFSGATIDLGELDGDGTVDAGDNSVNVGGKGGNSEFSGNVNISGNNDFMSEGAGTLTLSGKVSDDQSGRTVVAGGTLLLSGADNRLSTNAAMVVSNSAVLDLNARAQRVNGLTGGGVVTNSGGGTGALTVNVASGADTFSGALRGNMGFEKTGAGTQVLSGANTYSGATTIGGGTLRIDGNARLGNTGTTMTISNAGMLDVTAAGTLTNNITIGAGNGVLSNSSAGALVIAGGVVKDGTVFTSRSGSGTNIFTGVISGASANSDFIVDGGTTVFSNVMTYNGPTIITNGGTLVLGTNNATPAASGLVLGGGTLLIGDASTRYSTTFASLTLTADSTIDMGANGGLGTLTFGDSSLISWAGILTITNWQGVAANQSEFTKLVFGSTNGLTGAQLGQIQFSGYEQGGVLLGAEGELAPIPEAPVVWGAAAVTAFIFWRERRRLLAMFVRGRK